MIERDKEAMGMMQIEWRSVENRRGCGKESVLSSRKKARAQEGRRLRQEWILEIGECLK